MRLPRLLPILVVALGATMLLAGCERPPMKATQQGWRGTGMVQIDNPRIAARNADIHNAPESLPPADPEGPRAAQAFQNVKVLGHLSAGEFTRLMASMTAWIAPTEGCTYCHNAANFADDSNYRKVVARRMIEMTWNINANWKQHVADTGVTCYTCHRGHGVPTHTWTEAVEPRHNRVGMLGNDFVQNRPASEVKLASLPYDALTHFLLKDDPIRVISTTALPNGNHQTIKQTEWTYALMFQMADGLGVNCTFCHNTRAMGSWEASPPTRVKAWHGIRMAREINAQYIEPLKPVFPADRVGPAGDPLKAACSTCHQGIHKPLRGVSMLKDHPALAKAPEKAN
jgi:photosynthetic reaction center cytochrome c subunit